MPKQDKPLSFLWNQNHIPILFNRGKDDDGRVVRPWVKTPNGFSDFSLIKLTRADVEWNEKRGCFVVPSTWFNPLVKILLDRYYRLHIIQPYREKEICAKACKEAKGHICECQCLGVNHGSLFAGSGWYYIFDACEMRWNERKWGYRTLEKQVHQII